tara:strand:+ start:51 stop:332 length:282 start_codon:yes stop_codon:yes gene_type:complete
MKFSKIYLLSFLLLAAVACEDEKEETSNALNCASVMAEMEAANEAFEANATKANCEEVIKKAEAVYNCMPDGPEKTEMKEDLDSIRGTCDLFS